MRRLILFSEPEVKVLEQLKSTLFRSNATIKKLAYITPVKFNEDSLYVKFWRDFTKCRRFEFVPIDCLVVRKNANDKKFWQSIKSGQKIKFEQCKMMK